VNNTATLTTKITASACAHLESLVDTQTPATITQRSSPAPIRHWVVVTGDMRFDYFDTTRVMNCMLEIIEYGLDIEVMFKRVAEFGNGRDGENPIRTMENLFQTEDR